MPIEWTGLSPELLLRLDRGAAEPLRVQLERGLRDAIRSERLAAGERLPSSRELARELGISRGLVQECYAQLLAEGFLTARSGSGTRVAAGAASSAAGQRTASPAPPRPRLDFRLGSPDLGSFPRQDWMWAMREVSRTAPSDLLGYGDPRGTAQLREVLAAYLRRVRGAVVEPDRIVVCAGFAQGVNLVLRALARSGATTVASEDPGGAGDRATAEHWGLKALAVPVDERGLDVAALAATDASAVIVTPAHQSPTGVVLAPERRQALAEWADDRAGTIIEDDYDSEFRYDREPVGALQGLAPDHVALIGTVSKSLSPSLRLGWIVCPPRLLELVAAEKERDDRGCPALEQLTLATMIESGRFDKHLRRMRATYGKRRLAVVESVAEHAPGVTLHGLAAGIHLVARLPDAVDELEVVERAQERSVGLYPLSRYRADGQARPPQLVLGFGALSEPAIRRGIALVGDLLAPGHRRDD